MDCKKLPCWLKGGIIGTIIFVVFALALILTMNQVLMIIGEALEGVYLTTGLINMNGSLVLAGWAYSIIVWFILGALIGLIISKLKAKK